MRKRKIILYFLRVFERLFYISDFIHDQKYVLLQKEKEKHSFMYLLPDDSTFPPIKSAVNARLVTIITELPNPLK